MASQVAPRLNTGSVCGPGGPQDTTFPRESVVFVQLMLVPRSAVASVLWNLVLGVFFLLRNLEAPKASRTLKTSTTQKIPTSHGFLSRPFDEIHLCSLFLKLQMPVVPNSSHHRRL